MKKPIEQSSIYSNIVNNTKKETETKRILPDKNVNVMYVASAFQGVYAQESSFKSLWA